MNEELPQKDVLIGDMKLLDQLATKSQKERQEHPLQELLEEIIDDVLDDQEKELFWLKFGEQLSYRQIAKRLEYKSHRTFQLQIASIVKKVGEALNGRTNVRNSSGRD